MAEKEQVRIALDGETSSQDYETFLIPEDSYDAEIAAINQRESPNYNNPQVKETQFVFSCLIEGKELLLWVKPKITKGSISKSGKTYSNSKLFDILEKAGLLEKVKEKKEELLTLDGLQQFLSSNLVGKKARCVVKTRNKGGGEKEYSSVSEVLRFLEEQVGDRKVEVSKEVH